MPLLGLLGETDNAPSQLPPPPPPPPPSPLPSRAGHTCSPRRPPSSAVPFPTSPRIPLLLLPEGHVAFCAQVPWLPNRSARDVIVGGGSSGRGGARQTRGGSRCHRRAVVSRRRPDMWDRWGGGAAARGGLVNLTSRGQFLRNLVPAWTDLGTGMGPVARTKAFRTSTPNEAEAGEQQRTKNHGWS
ncbi:hypothetical protein B0J12DRAFT_185347 [Macrophomina phaseolina]|uniref:Uncharacterized protein n=1 Tax=Macrophomina phaseolina TaxID=35725 RepID=A0ABQ8G4W1_9PEZI|nr:hypothetical protein B0J12DRAFT_185347 [Macrophomina phaseolina]